MVLRGGERSYICERSAPACSSAPVGVVDMDGVADPEVEPAGLDGLARIVSRSLTKLSDEKERVEAREGSVLVREGRVEVGEFAPEGSLGVFGGGIFSRLARAVRRPCKRWRALSQRFWSIKGRPKILSL